MATASRQLSQDLLLCPICLDVFIDPVTVPCGHNFCKHCIDRYWVDAVTCTCPYCKRVFNTKPELMVNTVLSAMAANFRESENEVPCDICTDVTGKRKAIESCLVCLASYCESHIMPHRTMTGLMRHQLIKPENNLEERVCPQHNKLLELFCKDDQVCVCMLCTHSDHKDHKVVPLKEASEEQKQKLQETEAVLQQMIRKRLMKSQDLRRTVDNSNAAADTEITEGVMIYSALKEFVEKGLDNLVQEITRMKTTTENQGNSLIKDLEGEVRQLEKRSSKVGHFSQTADPLHLLQNLHLLMFIPPTRDWSNVHLCQPTYEGIVVRALAQLEDNFNKTTEKRFKAELERVKRFETDVTLDPNTAHPQLKVSAKRVQYNKETNIPDSPKKFANLFVLGEEGYSKSFYFEVDVQGNTEWTVGVAKQSVSRKEIITLSPENGFWTIGLKSNLYYALAGPEIRLPTKCRPKKVGVFVDYEKGHVSFYDVEAPALIYSYSGIDCKQQLHLICSPGRSTTPLVLSGVETWWPTFKKHFSQMKH